MTPKQRSNLLRLLKPRHVAVIGGRDAETVVGECARIGFSGAVWPVNPKRQEIGGQPCFTRLEDLPEPPDAAFIAVPREAAIESVASLSRMGAGGAVCYTAGFGETGVEGAAAEVALVAEAGDLALIGPNCYGLINYVDRVALWPFAHGGNCPGYGAAIITQSGMLSSDLTMSQRSVPFAYMVSAGNQSLLGLEDFVELLAEQPEVRAIGLHIEGLRSIPHFAEVALQTLERGIPIVALKTGASAIGSRLTVSHTGSLSGTDALYDALFERLGILRVASPAQLLETLKFLCVSGVPTGKRVAAFTCSGAGATMLADHAETIGLDFPQPSEKTKAVLKDLLPGTATISNPLDYTTPIWGLAERTGPVFEALLGDTHDLALLLQDYPHPGLDESKPLYTNDTKAFVAAAQAAGRPTVVCSTLPENIDRETRDLLIADGVAPMQGLQEALNAIAAAARYGARRESLLEHRQPLVLTTAPAILNAELIDEAAGKSQLAAAGVRVPAGRVACGREAAAEAARLGFPVALKMLSARLPHKSEAGAVRLDLSSPEEVEAAVADMRRAVARHDPAAATDVFLIERMAAVPAAKLLVGLRWDAQFGLAMTLASGGVLVELVGDAVTLLLPADRAEIAAALGRLRLARLLDGFRGRPAVDRHVVVDALCQLADYMVDRAGEIAEIEINPLFLYRDRVCAVDVLMRVTAQSDAAISA